MPGQVFIILACLCYGFEWWFVQKLVSLGLYPHEVAFYKGFFTAIILSTIFIAKGTLASLVQSLHKREWWALLLFGVLFLLANVFYMQALSLTKVMNVTVFSYMSVFLAPLAGVLFLGEKMKKYMPPLLVLAFVGVIFTLYKKESISISLGLGEILAFACAVAVTGTMFIVKKTPRVSPWIRILIAYIFCSLVLVVYIIWTGRLAVVFGSGEILFYGLIIALLAGTVGRGLKDIGTSKVPLHIAGVTQLLEPVFQIVSWLILGHAVVSGLNIFGAGLVLLAMLLTNIEMFKKKKPILESI